MSDDRAEEIGRRIELARDTAAQITASYYGRERGDDKVRRAHLTQASQAFIAAALRSYAAEIEAERDRIARERDIAIEAHDAILMLANHRAAERDAARPEVGRLRQALEPFAEIAKLFIAAGETGKRILYHSRAGILTVNDFIAAHIALFPPTEGPTPADTREEASTVLDVHQDYPNDGPRDREGKRI